jgi:hypothetical protein
VLAVIARAAAAAALLAACSASEPDPCGDAATCLRLNINGLLIDSIDQLELDVVIGGTTHSTVTTGMPGQLVSLPTSTSIKLAIPLPVISVDLIAAGRRAGVVVGLDGASAMVFGGDHHSVDLFLSSAFRCTEGELSCGYGVGLSGQPNWIYRCTDQVPIFDARCMRSCSGSFGSEVTCFDTGCAEGGHYCGGDKLDGDPHTLYICNQSRGTLPMRCPHSCVVTANGNDRCD